MLNVAEAEAAAATSALVFGTPRSPEREAYRIETARIKGEFLDYIKDEYGYGHSEEVSNRIAERAWEDGHSSGFYSVEQAAIDYAELADNDSEALWED